MAGIIVEDNSEQKHICNGAALIILNKLMVMMDLEVTAPWLGRINLPLILVNVYFRFFFCSNYGIQGIISGINNLHELSRPLVLNND